MSLALTLVRRAAEMRGLRRLTRVTPLLRVSFALRASLVVQSLRFALNELRGRDTTQVYTLRNSKIAVALRHHSPDVLVLDELFSQDEYAFPGAVVAALRETESPRAVDLGANIGLFGALVLNAFPRARVLSVEVDPGNAAVHEAAIAANAGSDWTLIRGAAGTSAGRAAYVLGHFATSRAAHPHELGSEVEVIDVLPLLAGADFVKIDIEGGEWAILDDPRFRQARARAIVLEYHSHLCPEEDPGEAAKRRLEGAGYSVEAGATKPRFGAGLLWGLRKEGTEA
jgi:FkbM family methyltransferase